MCGRYALTLPQDAMVNLFEAVPANDLPDGQNYNICPTDAVHVVVPGASRRLVAMRWGFLPHWYKSPTDGPLLINARSETIAEKPAFRAACRERRCLIPTSGFYEWTKDADGKRLPWFIRQPEPMVMAGIWQTWGHGDAEVNTCAVVTCPAGARMQAIHHRMPVILTPSEWPLWLGEVSGKAAPLMRSAVEDQLDFFRVDPKVNSNRASGPDLLEPIEDVGDKKAG
ncbi:MAG: SOS response-associated peptidase [Pseudomonadota bacterium]